MWGAFLQYAVPSIVSLLGIYGINKASKRANKNDENAREDLKEDNDRTQERSDFVVMSGEYKEQLDKLQTLLALTVDVMREDRKLAEKEGFKLTPLPKELLGLL